MSEEPKERSAALATIRTAGAGALIGVIVSAFLALSYLSPLGSVFEKWELTLYDFRLARSAHPEQVSQDLLVLRIDDETLRWLELQESPVTWPFPRWFYGELVALLEKQEPAAIVFDFVFSDQKDGARYGLDGDPFAEGADDDARVNVQYSRGSAQQMNHAGNVVHGIYAMNLDASAGETIVRNMIGWNAKLVPHFEARLPNAAHGVAIPDYLPDAGSRPVLRYPEANMLIGARALGLTNHQHAVDIDGNTRLFTPLVRVDGRVTADLATTSILVSQLPATDRVEWLDPEPPPASAWTTLPPVSPADDGIRIGKWRVPLDPKGRAYIRWRGDWDKDPALLARTRNVLDIWRHHDAILLGEPNPVKKEDYKGKIILIGFTGQGEGADFVTTPFGTQPGVFRHAAIVDTILTQDFPEGMPSFLNWLVAFVFAGVTGAVVLARARTSTRFSSNTAYQVSRLLVVGFVPVVGFFIFAMSAFALGGGSREMSSRIIEMVPALLSMIATIPPVVFLGIAWEQAAERRARKIANRALGPALVKQVLAGGGELKMGGKKVPLTLFFSDIAGFTTISEKLTPEELINMLNEYLTRVSEILHDGHGATIDKYIGDAVMAFWGAPLPQPDGPVRACLAAIDVMAAIDKYSAELVAQGLSPLRTRIGLNSGWAVAGGVGHIRDLDDGKFTYTAMGDTVNLASRLEGANKAYGTTCMIGQQTYEEAKHAIFARELDLIRVKGKTIPVRVFELIGKAGDPFPEKRKITERYERALGRFRQREFAAAREEFLALVTEFGDSPSKTLAASCDEYLKNPPPPDWDGSNELHEK